MKTALPFMTLFTAAGRRFRMQLKADRGLHFIQFKCERCARLVMTKWGQSSIAQAQRDEFLFMCLECIDHEAIPN